MRIRKSLGLLFILAFSTLVIQTALWGQGWAYRLVQYFTDVPPTHPNFYAIEWLRQRNIVWKNAEKEYKPERFVTRAEFVALLVNPLFLADMRVNECLHSGSGSTLAQPFPDVYSDAWYAKHVCFAKHKRLVDGYPDGTFKPTRAIGFAEAAKITVNTFRHEHEPEDLTDPLWYKPYVQKLAENRAIPLSIQTFEKRVSRADMAEVIFRVKEGYRGRQYRQYKELERGQRRADPGLQFLEAKSW